MLCFEAGLQPDFGDDQGGHHARQGQQDRVDHPAQCAQGNGSQQAGTAAD
jgi:hypothetical protein